MSTGLLEGSSWNKDDISSDNQSNRWQVGYVLDGRLKSMFVQSNMLGLPSVWLLNLFFIFIFSRTWQTWSREGDRHPYQTGTATRSSVLICKSTTLDYIPIVALFTCFSYSFYFFSCACPDFWSTELLAPPIWLHPGSPSSGQISCVPSHGSRSTELVFPARLLEQTDPKIFVNLWIFVWKFDPTSVLFPKHSHKSQSLWEVRQVRAFAMTDDEKEEDEDEARGMWLVVCPVRAREQRVLKAGRHWRGRRTTRGQLLHTVVSLHSFLCLFTHLWPRVCGVFLFFFYYSSCFKSAHFTYKLNRLIWKT